MALCNPYPSSEFGLESNQKHITNLATIQTQTDFTRGFVSIGCKPIRNKFSKKPGFVSQIPIYVFGKLPQEELWQPLDFQTIWRGRYHETLWPLPLTPRAWGLGPFRCLCNEWRRSMDGALLRSEGRRSKMERERVTLGRRCMGASYSMAGHAVGISKAKLMQKGSTHSQTLWRLGFMVL